METLRGCPCMLWVLLRGQEKFLPPHASRASSSASGPRQPREGASGKQWFVLRFPFFLSPPPATITIHHLCVQTPDKTILYSVATTLVNCTNSYDVKEVIPELVQLAKFSKQHVPEEHPKVGMRMAESGRGLSTPDHQRGGTES